MKKVLSLTLALIMFVTSVSTFTTTFADDEHTHIKTVETQIEKAAQNIIANTYDMNSISYGDYWLLLNSGADMSAYKDAYLARLKANLDKNNGKIVIEGTEWYQDENDNWQSYSYSYEDIAVYGAVILTLDSYGYFDAEKNAVIFRGYNLTSDLLNFDLSTISNPYSYRLAVAACGGKFAQAEFAKTLVDDMITRFYKMGSGLENWGFSCDNTGHFLAAMGEAGELAESYKDSTDDAKSIIRSYTKDEGAYCDFTYNPSVNADSTALAMMGFAAMKDYESASWYYDKLIGGFYNEATGAFQAANYTTGALEDNDYATKDALLALEYYYKNMFTCEVVTPATCTSAGLAKYTCVICGATEERELAPAHSFGTWKETKAATCTESAIEERTCAVCAEKETQEFAALGHSLTLVPAKKSTETTEGNNAYYSCSVCGKYFKDADGVTETTPEAEALAKLPKATTKKKNTIKVKARKPVVKAAKLKKKNQTIARKNAMVISDAKGKLTFKKIKGNAKITVNKTTGKITLKKGLKKGTYTVKIKVSAAGNKEFKAGSKTVTIKIKVK